MTLTLDPATAHHLARAAEVLQSTPEEVAQRFLRLMLASCAADSREERAFAFCDLCDWRGDVLALLGEGS